MRWTKLSILLLAFIICSVSQQYAVAQYAIPNSVVGNGGDTTEGGGYRIMGTVGQPAIGVTEGASNDVYGGFWYTSGSSSEPQEPQISVTPSTLAFSAVAGESNPATQALSISNSGSGTLSWEVTDDADWLSMSPTAGDCTTETDEVTVSVDISGVDEGTHNATITVSAAGATNSPQTVSVTLNIQGGCESLVIQAYSPVDLTVTDPWGRAIDKDTSEIPLATYTQEDLNGDSDPDDNVTIPSPEVGTYSIAVAAEAGASGTDTYTLDVIYGAEATRLAEDVQVQSIPAEPYTYTSLNYCMREDWNLISIPVELLDDDLHDVLQSISGFYTAVWMYDDNTSSWKKWIDGVPDFLNNLETIDTQFGLWIDMSQSAVLTISGELDDDPHSLSSGWNLHAFNHLTAQERDDGLSSIAGNFNSVWSFNNSESSWEKYVIGVPDFLNDLTIFKPGSAYWIDTTSICSWDVNGGGVAAPASPIVIAGRDRNSTQFERPELPYTVWGTVMADGVKVGEEGTLFLKVDGKIKSSCRMKAASGYGHVYTLDVPPVNDESNVELYVQIGDAQAKAAPVPFAVPGQSIRFDLSVQIPPTFSMLHQNYPNPFNPETWIPYQLREEAQVVIKIYASTGQLVRTLNLGKKPAGFYTDRENAAHWNGRNEAGERVASGIYFYSIKAGDLTTNRKMVVKQ